MQLIVLLIGFLPDYVRVSLHSQVKLIELFGVHFARGIGQKALTSLGFRKCNDISDIFRSGQQHNHPVEAEGYSAVRWGAVIQCLQKETEPLLCLAP